MLLIAAFAINIIVVKRVRFMRRFTLTGANARSAGIGVVILHHAS